MKTESESETVAKIVPVDIGSAAATTGPTPTVQAKRPAVLDAAGEGEAERSAAEIVRMSSWATAECGGTILAD